MPTDRARFAKDFFFELMKDSQRLRAGFLAERERWLRSLAVDGREEILFEFEMLLRGTERFFNLHNLPLDAQGPVLARDFSGELRAVRDAVSRAVRLARFLLDPPSDRRLVFRKYLESKVADDRVRRELIDQELEQSSPEESLFLIRSGFAALRGVLDQLLELPRADYQLFADVGQLVLREMGLNKYFKPFRALEFRPEYDRIKDVRILDLLTALDERTRRPASMGFLALFRALHYLRYVPRRGEAQTLRSLVLLALIRSEVASLATFLETDLATRLAQLAPDRPGLVASVAQALRAESVRIAHEHLASDGEGHVDAGAAREELGRACRATAVELAQALAPGSPPPELGDDTVGAREQARRLRFDLFAFREICFEAAVAIAGSAEAATASLETLRRFLGYFRDVSFQLLRYSDFDPFERFASIVGELDAVPVGAPARARLAKDCEQFADIVGRTLKMVAQRQIIRDEPIDEERARTLVKRFRGADRDR